MVCWNSAEAEIDEEKGEIVLISRHKLERGNKELSAKKYPKIYGAVSVLLVEQNNRSFDSEGVEIGIDTSNETELESTDKSAERSEHIQSSISNGFNKIAIPASLSLIPVPLFGLPKTNFAQHKVCVPKSPPISSTVTEPRNTPLYKETFKPHNDDRSFDNTGNNETPPDCSVIVLDSTVEESNSLPNKSGSAECFTSRNQYHDHKTGNDENSPPLYRMQASMLGINDCQVPSQSTGSYHGDNHHQQPQLRTKIKPKSNKGHPNSRSQLVVKSLQQYQNGDHDHDGHDTCLYCHVRITELDEIINHALTNHEVKPDELMVILCPLCKGTYSKHDLHEFMEHVKYHINCRKKKESTLKDSHTMSMLGMATNSLHSNFMVNKFAPSRSIMNRTSSDPRKPQTGFSSQKMGGFRVRLGLKKDTASNKPLRFQRKLVRVSSANPKTCVHCDQRIISYRDIMRHNKLHGFSDMCPICSRTFGIRSGLLRHCMTHIQSRVHSCHYCSAIFTRSDNLSRHVSTVHMKSPKDTSTLVKTEDSNNSLYKASDKSADILDGECLNKNPDDLDLASKDMVTTLPNIDPWTSQESGTENDIQSETVVIDDRSQQEMLIDDECTDKNMTGVENISQSPATSHESGRELSTLNYACSACEINFLTLEHLKRHVVFAHAEQVSNEENIQTGEPEETEQIDIPGSSNESESNAGQKSSSSAGDLLGEQVRDSSSASVGQIQIKQEFDESEVIDIENLSEFTEFHRFSQDVKCEPEEEYHNPKFFSNKDNAVASSVDRAPPPETGSFMDSFISLGGGNLMTGFYGESNQDLGTTPSSSSHFDMSNSEMQQQLSGGLFDSMMASSDMNGSITDLDFSQQRDEMLQSVHGSSSQSSPLSQKHLLAKSTSGKRKRYLTSTLPICHFCEVYIQAENGGSILRHGDTHKDLFNSNNTCTICLAELSGRDSLHRHASSHVGTWFSCKFCDNAFSRKDNLKRHIKKAHPGVQDT